jgi:hypothetical protein
MRRRDGYSHRQRSVFVAVFHTYHPSSDYETCQQPEFRLDDLDPIRTSQRLFGYICLAYRHQEYMYESFMK